MPCFEEFGNLPTDLVKEDGYVSGKPASEILDMIIIPGGSIVESQTLKDNLAKEITKMADKGKFVLGICSGFQVLSKGTDIGRLSATPIMREGLGLIDAEFSPLICTDQIRATVVGSSLLTDAVGAEVSGFHCHTYGNVISHKEAKPILVSHTKRLNYHKNQQDIVSGIANLKGNVVGIIIHQLLDQNKVIIDGISKSLDISPEELFEIRKENSKLLKQIKCELGVSTGIQIKQQAEPSIDAPKSLLVTALGSGSGKTFIVTGIAGALKKRGVKVGIVKVGGDIRDIVPALYVIKEPMKKYSSIKIGESGWKATFEVLKEASKDHSFIIIEGAMSAFTGLLMDNVSRPMSTAEVAASLAVPTLLVVACDKEGIEGAMVSALNYVDIFKKLGINTAGVILNKARTSYLTDDIRQVMKKAFVNAGTELVGIVPRIDLEGRGAIPEVEIKYEEFTAKAIETAESSIDIDKIMSLAGKATENQINYGLFVEKFKALVTGFGSSMPEVRGKEKCS